MIDEINFRYKDVNISLNKRKKINNSFYYLTQRETENNYNINISIFGIRFPGIFSVDFIDSENHYYSKETFKYVTNFGFLCEEDLFNSDRLSYSFNSKKLNNFLILDTKDVDANNNYKNLSELKSVAEQKLMEVELKYLLKDENNEKEYLFLKNIYQYIENNKDFFYETTMNSNHYEKLIDFKDSLYECADNLYDLYFNENNSTTIVFSDHEKIEEASTNKLLTIMKDITNLEVYNKQKEITEKYKKTNKIFSKNAII